MSFVRQYIELQSEDKLKTIVSLADRDFFELGGKRYPYRKISMQQYVELEKLFDDTNNKTTQMEYIESLATCYEKRALYFLGMSHDEFIAVPWEESRPVLDACMYRTIHGKPGFLGNLQTISGSAAKSPESPKGQTTS